MPCRQLSAVPYVFAVLGIAAVTLAILAPLASRADTPLAVARTEDASRIAALAAQLRVARDNPVADALSVDHAAREISATGIMSLSDATMIAMDFQNTRYFLGSTADLVMLVGTSHDLAASTGMSLDEAAYRIGLGLTDASLAAKSMVRITGMRTLTPGVLATIDAQQRSGQFSRSCATFLQAVSTATASTAIR